MIEDQQENYTLIFYFQLKIQENWSFFCIASNWWVWIIVCFQYIVHVFSPIVFHDHNEYTV